MASVGQPVFVTHACSCTASEPAREHGRPQLRAQGLEPWTHGLKGKRTGVQYAPGQALTSEGAPVCCPVYSPDAKTDRAEPANADPEHVAGTSSPAVSDATPSTPGAGAEPDVGPVGEHFAEAVAMLARLPLTDAERTEAVRRLLAGAGAPV